MCMAELSFGEKSGTFSGYSIGPGESKARAEIPTPKPVDLGWAKRAFRTISGKKKYLLEKSISRQDNIHLIITELNN